ncbi:MAG: CHAT domain-containing protein [Woeseiaceae bacterium]
MLNGDEVHIYALGEVGDVRITVENLGRGTILSIIDGNGERILRTANWRGIEGLHSAVLSIDQPVKVEVSPDEPVAPPGQYRIRVEHFSRDDPLWEAERAMSVGADLRLRHYYGEGDRRQEALAEFLRAAEAFEIAQNNSRLADAQFEAADVSFALGDHEEARTLYADAGAIWTALGDQAGMATSEMQLGLLDWRTNRPDSAIRLFRQAADRRKAQGAIFFYAQAVNNMGLVYRDLGDARTAVGLFTEALEHWQGSADLLNVDPAAIEFAALEQPPWLQHALIAMNNIGWAYEVIAETATAQQYLLQALRLSEYLDNGRIAAELRNNLGRLSYQTGNLQQALDYLDESLVYFTSVSNDEIWAAHVHQSKALVYRASGDLARAELELRNALNLRTTERDPVGRAQTLLALAELNMELGKYPEAQSHISSALGLIGMQNENRVTAAQLHDLAGGAFVATGEPAAAMEHYELALVQYMAANDRRGEAEARAHRAIAQARLGHVAESEVGMRVALQLAREIDDKLLQFQVMVGWGRMLAVNGETVEALDMAVQALGISEELRAELVDPSLLRDFALVQHDAFDVLVYSALSLGDIEAAWRAADQARARRFTDLVRDRAIGLSTLSESEQARYQSLLRMRAVHTEEKTRLLFRQETSESAELTRRLDQVQTELASVIDEIDQMHAGLRTQANELLATVSLKDLQSVLTERDLVVEYYFGDLQNGVWSISQYDIVFRPLPPLADIAPELESVVAGLRQPASSSDNEALLSVSRILLAADGVGNDRATNLIIIPDALLHFVPFSILLDPAHEFRQSLIESRSISYLPSVGALFELGRRPRGNGSGIAVMADPVYGPDDPRLAQGENEPPPMELVSLDPELQRAAARTGRDQFPRLPGTRAESDAIRDVAGDRFVTTMLDTRANLDAVVDGSLNGFRIIHFATHGILDADVPALSGLVLSGISADGLPRAQFLRAQDIALLRLQADLVVLSACETALGRTVRGEGVDGLTRAFFYAGAKQVVSSLWQVPDRATVELMRRFYREMLQNGKVPVDALRLAQLQVRSDRRWRAPYYWAAFIVHGDWR